MKNEIIRYYKYNGDLVNRFPALAGLFVSPRSYAEEIKGDVIFDICTECNNEGNKPKLAIKNIQIGEAPEELTCLNEMELAFVSQGRIDKHTQGHQNVASDVFF